MAQVFEEYKKERVRATRDIFVAISDKKTRTILDILHSTQQMTYTDLMNDWLKVNEIKRQSSGRFAYHLRKLMHYFLIDKLNNRFYTLSFKGKKIYNAISIINQTEKINMSKYPSCVKIRVSNVLNDEELLNEAVRRIVKEVRKIK